MADPMTSKLATQVMTKALENSATETSKAQSTPNGANCQEMLGNASESHTRILELLGENPASQTGLSGSMESISAADIPVNIDTASMGHTEGGGGEKLMHMLSDFNQQQGQMDLLVNQIMYGDKKFTNQELLAVQAHVFHIAQMTELTVKSVELAVSSFKGVMNTQIQ